VHPKRERRPDAGVRGNGNEERPAGAAVEGRRVGGGHRSTASGRIGYALVRAIAAPPGAHRRAYVEGVARNLAADCPPLADAFTG
jgi:hypothetical protein